MNRKHVLRALPWGLLSFATVVGITAYVDHLQHKAIPPAEPPPPGETLTAEAAARLHPAVAPAPFDASEFTRLPAECGCELASGRVQLLMHVRGQQQTMSPAGNAVYVVHDVAVARAVDGGEQAMPFPKLDDVAPATRTEGFFARFDVACTGDRLLVVDAVHATLWDLAKRRPKKLWSTALPARRGEVKVAERLGIECQPAKIEGDVAVVAPVGKGAALRLQLADGALAPSP